MGYLGWFILWCTFAALVFTMASKLYEHGFNDVE
jgi:hypothetical protein